MGAETTHDRDLGGEKYEDDATSRKNVGERGRRTKGGTRETMDPLLYIEGEAGSGC